MFHKTRQRLRARTRLLAIAGAALILGACGGPSTTLDQSWSAPARSAPQLQRVVTLFVGTSVTMRHHAEDQLARDLRGQGLDATSSYAILGDEPITDLEAAKPKLLAMGYDGLVTMKIVDRENTVRSVPGFDGYYGGYYGYYGYGWGGDYLYPETIYRIETVAYSLQTGKLVWSGTTKSVDPDTLDELIEDTTEVVAGQLTRRVEGG
jgi:hypothetical protein